MYTEQELNEAMFKVVEQNKVPYTQDGLDFLLEETIKLLPECGVTFQIESIEEMSVQDRAEGKLPKISVIYQ
jgi:hypothetical protein